MTVSPGRAELLSPDAYRAAAERSGAAAARGTETSVRQPTATSTVKKYRTVARRTAEPPPIQSPICAGAAVLAGEFTTSEVCQ